MTKISHEEVLNIARISAISLHEQEIDAMIDQLDQMLSYAKRVTEVATNIEEPSMKNSNIMRGDLVVAQSSEPIILQAPERAGDFFVVPMILDN